MMWDYPSLDGTHRIRGEFPPEKRLWRGVFVCALRDAMAFKGPAIAWLLLDQVDAPRVCEFADIDLKKLRPRIERLLLEMAEQMVYEGRKPKYDVLKGTIAYGNVSKDVLQPAKSFLESSLGQTIRMAYENDERAAG